MRMHKSFLLSAIILLVPALVVLLSSSPIEATTTCLTYDCTSGDTTVDDFVQGLFYATGLSNLGTGGVQLLPMGLTSEWTDTINLPDARNELAAVSYGNILYVIGGNDTSNVRHAEIFSATTYITGPIKPSGWQTPTLMPAPLSGVAAAISTTTSGGYLYIAGGYDIVGDFVQVTVPTSTISYRQITTNGAFTGSWHSVYNALPTAMYYATAVVRNGNLYVIGGYDNVDALSTVYRFPISADGTLGSAVTESNQLNITRHSAPSTVWKDEFGVDHLYVLGGQSSPSTTEVSVERTIFQSGNSIGPFTNQITDQLLSTLTAHGAVQSNGRMFVTGGQEGVARVPITKVNSALIDPNASLHRWGSNAWVVSTPLPRPRSYHGTAINIGGEIYVIGGYGDPSFGEDLGTTTVYHGSTNGFGSHYAPSGNFVSRLIDLTTIRPITQIDINSTITGTATMTVQYRAGNDKNAMPSTWTSLPRPLQMGTNITTTYYVSITASLVQYRVALTSTNPYTLTPIINSFTVKYPSAGLADLTVVGMDTPNSTTSGLYTMTVYIQNNGQAPSRPVLNNSLSTKSNATTRPRITSPRIPNSPTIVNPPAYFVDVYIDRTPANAGVLGDCYGIGAGVNPNQMEKINIPNCNIPIGSHNYWAQVDTCDEPTYCSSSWGFIREANEANNILGPVPSGTRYLRWLYLPIISK
ncbi:MAG: hypothetical protein HZB51_25645 [Chloroflexi bacterium]|nr:hypothetical protein [Chloroflexota bacterium]